MPQPMLQYLQVESRLNRKREVQRHGTRCSLEGEVPDNAPRPRPQGALPDGNRVGAQQLAVGLARFDAKQLINDFLEPVQKATLTRGLEQLHRGAYAERRTARRLRRCSWEEVSLRRYVLLAERLPEQLFIREVRQRASQLSVHVGLVRPDDLRPSVVEMTVSLQRALLESVPQQQSVGSIQCQQRLDGSAREHQPWRGIQRHRGSSSNSEMRRILATGGKVG